MTSPVDMLRGWSTLHPTGATVALTSALAIVLSALPLPSWLQPLDVFQAEEPVEAILDVVLRRKASGGASAHGAIADITDSDVAAEEPQKAEVIPTAARARTKWVAPVRTKYDDMRRGVNASPLPVDVPCVEPAAQGCTRFALDRFFGRLAAAESGEEGATVRVVHFGDSLIASDHITDLVRQRLHERFGSGGRGMLLVDRLGSAGRRVRTGNASPGWTLDVITMANPKDKFFGYTGASFTASKDGESSEFDVGVNRDVEIHYLAYEAGGVLDIEADGKVVGTVDMKSATPESRIHRLTLPEGTALMRLVARTKGTRVYGVSLEAHVPGVVYESLGLPGATSEVWLVPDEAVFAQHLAARKPSLLVTMLGGNDGLMLSKKRTTIEAIEANTTAFVQRLRRAAPDVDCLMVSPMDAARVKTSGEMTSKPEVREVLAVIKKVAAAQGCAFWDMWGSMGGDGSLERWWNAKMINPDMIHPRGYGGDLLGELMVTALMEAYDVQHPPAVGAVAVAPASPGATPSPSPTAATKPPPITLPPVLVVEPIQIRVPSDSSPAVGDGADAVHVGSLDDPGGRALAPFFEKLARLETEKAGRAAVAMFGSTHVATHKLADVMRAQLGPRFGDRGRGFVPVGRYTKGLSDAGTERVLKGAFDVFDGRAAVEGKPALYGMSGTRTELRRGGQFIFVPCTQCDSSVGSGVFDVFFWSAPGMAWAKVTVSGAPPQIVGRSPAQRELGVRRYATDAARPRLDVEVEGPGTLTLFGVAHELDRPGVVVDPIALAGVTPSVMLRWDADIVMGMIARRRADLLVIAYGEVEAQSASVDEPAYRRDLARTLRRLRIAAAEAPCLVVGPPPSLRSVAGSWEEWPAVAVVETLQREAARAEGCAFWSMRQGIGGAAELRRWASEGTGRVSDDRSLLTEAGLGVVGERLTQDVVSDYERWKSAGPDPRAANN
jgi:hypothetical protein